MEEEKSKREIFKDVNQRKRMDKVYQNLSPSTSFADLKKHSGKRFKEINDRLKEETRKRKEKKERKNQKRNSRVT